MKSVFRTNLHIVIAVLLGAAMLALACASSAPQEVEIPVKLDGDKLNPETIQVGQGDTVTLKIAADKQGDIHLHGYDKEVEIGASEVTNFLFVADATGRFRITFHAKEAEHGSHGEPTDEHSDEEEIDVGYLEVRPR